MTVRKKVFHSRGDLDLIQTLLKLPLEERKKEIVHCDLPSLAKMMQNFPAWQVNEIANAMPSDVRSEFVRVVKIYKGEIAAPKRKVAVRKTVQKKKTFAPLMLALMLGVLILVIEVFAPH